MDAFFSFLADSLDIPVLNWIYSHLRTPFGDIVMPFFSALGDSGILWIGLSVVLLLFPRHRRVGLSMGVALLLGVILCNLTLKPLTARIRPYDYLFAQTGIRIPLLVAPPSDFSFPSGHTMASFCAATALLVHRKFWGIGAMCVAVCISFSRLYLYVHYPTDVLFSAVSGVGLGLLSVFLVNKGYEKIPRRS